MASNVNLTNKVYRNCGPVETTILTTLTTEKAAVVGLSLANTTLQTVVVSVYVEDDSSTKGYYIKNLKIPAGGAARVVNGGEKLLLAPENSITVISDTTNSIDAIVSFVLLTVTP